jgi:hypothetical protein
MLTMTSSTLTLYAPPKVQTRSAYLVNPFFDLTFVCGGLVLALTAIFIFRFGLDSHAMQQNTPFIVLDLFGIYLLSGPHTGATLIRLYGEAENRRRLPFVSYLLPAILIIAFVFGLFVPRIARLEATLYLLLVWHHYMAQSYGIAMMYCARSGMRLTEQIKFWPRLILYFSVTLAVCQQFTQEWQRSSFLNIPLESIAFLPVSLVTVLQVFLLAAIVAFIFDQRLKAKNGQSAMPFPAVIVLLSGAFFVTLGRSLSDLLWLFVPAFFHGTQYLAVVLARQHKINVEKIKPVSLIKTVEQLADRYGEFFLIDLALFTVLPFGIAALGIPLYLASALVFFTLSFHHFAADACIWKLKDTSVHSRLIP